LIIVQVIVKQRVTRPITTVGQLSDLVAHVKRERQTHLHPATKVFQALRIAVNRELDVLTQSLQQVWPLLQSGARLITISFHEGEDRIVKMFVKGLIENGEATAITKKPLQPSAQELEHNLRARSAKLRAVEKVQKGTV
jgi:16S rRNA (cytosine1402-N4)-methyltransferase